MTIESFSNVLILKSYYLYPHGLLLDCLPLNPANLLQLLAPAGQPGPALPLHAFQLQSVVPRTGQTDPHSQYPDQQTVTAANYHGSELGQKKVRTAEQTWLTTRQHGKPTEHANRGSIYNCVPERFLLLPLLLRHAGPAALPALLPASHAPRARARPAAEFLPRVGAQPPPGADNTPPALRGNIETGHCRRL